MKAELSSQVICPGCGGILLREGEFLCCTVDYCRFYGHSFWSEPMLVELEHLGVLEEKEKD